VAESLRTVVVAAAMAVGRASVGESGVSVYTTDRPTGLIFL
jgi:hypothetical protein